MSNALRMCRPHLAARAIPDDDLMRRLRDACVAAGRVLSQSQFERLRASRDPGCPSYRPYQRRWGSWPAVLAALRVWVAAHDPGFPYRGQLPGAGDYGERINVPGMLHAPVNISGVVLLFGVMARDLGFAIVHVGGRGEPLSCEVRRRHGDVWERKRLVFALASRDLKGRDLSGCDLLVCWAHDWPDCPLEVTELRKEAAKHA